MSTHLAETGLDPDLDYNLLLVEKPRPPDPPKQQDFERVLERDLLWARKMMDKLAG